MACIGEHPDNRERTDHSMAVYRDGKNKVDVWVDRQVTQDVLYHMDIRYIIPDHRTRLVVVGLIMGMYGLLWVLRTI